MWSATERERRCMNILTGHHGSPGEPVNREGEVKTFHQSKGFSFE